MNNDMDIQASHALLCKIIDRGGIYGAVAKKCLGISKTEHEYVLECYEQVHVPGAVSLLGIELIEEIVDYKLRFGGGIDWQKEEIKIKRFIQLLNEAQNSKL